ncbi:class I SAM-dependent methyltransferase [Noviherbaspirillum aerium]|uniref:class I SAM-dependent methyltransferase n=1 Tax=Noviherbaspirillum aerium TaxID=2588497 RepID=UPI00124BED21|nr:class I SAM-dependent methyltransferase [Noviherbaspirillum aerium]
MKTANIYRISPLLEVRGEEIDLPYAPSPWILKQCAHTGVIFLANPPAYTELSDNFAYEVTFKRESEARQKAEPIRYAISTTLKRIRGRLLKRNKTLKLLRSIVSAKQEERINVLDIGCGWGELLENFLKSLPPSLKNRCVPHGIEISRELSRLSDSKLQPLGGRCLHASAQDGILGFEDQYFDVIVMASFLEHEANPLPVLIGCRTRLKPNGTILIKVPNYDCYNRRLRGPKWCGFRWPDHVNYFTPTTLKAIVEASGLEIVRMAWLDRNPLSDNMYAVVRKKVL